LSTQGPEFKPQYWQKTNKQIKNEKPNQTIATATTNILQDGEPVRGFSIL
jgi:hypothetical protein